MKNYVIDNLPDYFKQYKNPSKTQKFWDKIADENFDMVPKMEQSSKIRYGRSQNRMV